MCKALKRGWSHVLYVQVCIRGRKGDDDALSSLGLDGGALLFFIALAGISSHIKFHKNPPGVFSFYVTAYLPVFIQHLQFYMYLKTEKSRAFIFLGGHLYPTSELLFQA